MLVMKHKTFKAISPFGLTLKGPVGFMNLARADAENFINTIGAEKVVSITEHMEHYTVTVWYRDEVDARLLKRDAVSDEF